MAVFFRQAYYERPRSSQNSIYEEIVSHPVLSTLIIQYSVAADAQAPNEYKLLVIEHPCTPNEAEIHVVPFHRHSVFSTLRQAF